MNKFHFRETFAKSENPTCTRNHVITYTNCTPLSSITIMKHLIDVQENSIFKREKKTALEGACDW